MPRTVAGLRGRFGKLQKIQQQLHGVATAAALLPAAPAALLLEHEQGAALDGSLLPPPVPSAVEDMEADMEAAFDEAALGEVADELATAQETTAEEAVQHNGATPPARHVGTGTGGRVAPRYAFVDAKDPDHAAYIFDASYYRGVPESITDVLVRETWQLDEGAYGGCPDQRSIDGRALKGEAGSKSLCRGYAVQDGTRWMIAQHVGLATHQVLSFSELFDCKLMVHLWQTGKEGRPPVPEPRSGAQLFDKVCDLRKAFEQLAWTARNAKRETNFEAALEVEALTEPVYCEISGADSKMLTVPIDVRLFGVPGITGVTWNVQPVVDGKPCKVEKKGSYAAESTEAASYRIVNNFPPASRGSGAAHCDDADVMEQRVKHLGIKHSAASVIFLYSRDPYELMVGGEFNMILPKGPKGIWKKSTMPKTGTTLCVSSKEALLVVNHASKSYHMASAAAAVRNACEGEPDLIDAMQPGTRTRTTSDSDSPKVVCIRGSVVMHTSEVPIVSVLLARKKKEEGSLAAALTAKQKRWRVEYGIGALNANERVRPSLAPLRARVKDFPINGPLDGITEETMAPFFKRAWEHRTEFYALGADGGACDGAEELEHDRSSDTDSEGDESAEEADAAPAPRVRKAPERLRK